MTALASMSAGLLLETIALRRNGKNGVESGPC